MITHTRAPWYVIGTNPPRVYARDGLDIIAQCDSGKESSISQELANARLIAAAPNLLRLLIDIEAHLYDGAALHPGSLIFAENAPAHDVIVDAIAKATRKDAQ